MGKLIIVLLVLVFVGGIILAVVFGEDMKNCKRSHTQTTTTFMMVGKVMMPVTSTYQVCDEWYTEAPEEGAGR